MRAWTPLGSAVLALALAACGASGDGAAVSSEGGGAPSSSSSGAGGNADCQAGEVAAADGACFSVGLRACAPVFTDADGVCRPAIEKCPAGKVPKFDEGCVDAGIPSCAPVFAGSADGICHPTQKACGPGTFAVPQLGCVSIDGPGGCGAGTWGDIPDGATTLYVDAAAAAGGDGSKGAPLRTIAEALARATPVSVIALAAGDYAEPVAITSDVTIAGRCASMVKISGVDAATQPAKIVRVTGAKATLTGVTIGGLGVGVYASQAEVTLDRVVVDGAFEAGILVEHGSRFAVKRSLVQNTAENETSTWSPNDNGFGLSARSTSAVTITDSAFVANSTVSVHGLDLGTTVTAKDVLVEATVLTFEDVGAGVAAFAFDADIDTAAAFDLEAVALVGNQGYAIDLTVESSAPPTMKIRDSLVEGANPYSSIWLMGSELDVRNTVAVGEGSFALTDVYGGHHAKLTVDQSLLLEGTLAILDGDVTISDTAIVAATPPGLLLAPDTVNGAGEIHADLRGVFISIAPKPKGAYFYAYGIYLGGDAALRVDATVVSRAHAAGILANQRSKLTVTGSLVSGTEEGTFYVDHDKQTAADGIVAADHAVVSLDGVRIERCGRAGMLFAGAGGAVARSLSTKNQFGLVLEAQTKVDVDGSNAIAKNTDQDRVGNSTLPVPTTPASGP